MCKIMFSAGEVSGDMHGARLAEAIKKQAPDTELLGFGGKSMAEKGVRLVADMSDYNVMGVVDVILNLRRIFSLMDKLTEVLRQEKPDLLVLIDYPDFNWRLAKRAKKLGIPVFSYIPPSAWAWRKGRAKKCAALADEFVAIFPFETKVYEDAGANISFVGNPLVDTVKPSMTKDEARHFFGIEEGMYPIMLLPGSRKQEIELLLPVMLAGAKLIKQNKPEAVFFLPVAQGVNRARIEELIRASGLEVRLTEEKTYDLMGVSEFALATSGTVIMEAALMGMPCIVLYRFSKLNYCIGKLLVHIDHFSLPNILAGRRVLPELLQSEVNPQRILSEAEKYWDLSYLAKVKNELKEISSMLGEPDASGRVAARILAAARKYGKSAGEAK